MLFEAHGVADAFSAFEGFGGVVSWPVDQVPFFASTKFSKSRNGQIQIFGRQDEETG
jgi:hypothetical protein